MAEAIGSLVVRIGGDATDLIDAFARAGKATENLNSKVKAGIANFKALAAALEIREMAAFIKNVADAEDALLKMSERTGLAVEALSELAYSASLANVSSDELGVGLRQLAKNMVDAQAGSLEARQAFVALFGANWSMKATEQQLLDIADKFQGMQDGAGKAALALKLFGKNGTELIPLLNMGSAGLRANAEEARKLGIVLSTDAAKQASEFNDNLKRLEASSAALARTIAGPLVKAFSEAAAEMIRAKKEGESFFETYLRGYRMLFTGDDAHKWNEDFVRATNRLLEAQNKLDEVKNTFSQTKSPFDADQVKLWVAEVAKAQAEVDRLRSIKSIVAPEAPKPEEPDKKKAPELVDLAKARARALELFHLQSADEQRLADERIALQDDTDKLLKDRINALEAYRLASEQDLNAKIAAFTLHPTSDDAGLNPARDARLVALAEQLKSAEQLENEAHRRALAQLQEFTDSELEIAGGRHAAEQQLERDHQSRMLQIRGQGLTTLSAFSKASWGEQTKTVIGMLADMTAAAATKNKQMFEINKVASMANAIVKGWEAVQSSYAFGSSWGGPVGGAAMAAIAAAATLANVAAISSTTFGSGTAPSATPTAAPAVTPVQTSGTTGLGGGGGGGQTTVIHLNGESFSRKQLRDLLEAVNENNRDGGRLLVDG